MTETLDEVTTPVDEKPLAKMTDAEQCAFFDTLLEQSTAEFYEKNPRPTMAEAFGDYQPVKGKSGVYMRERCAEIEIRMLELAEQMTDGTAAGLARFAMTLAEAVLYRLNLPGDREEARQKVIGYARGTVDEEEIFVPMTAKQIGRRFKSLDEISELVLAPLGLELKTEEGAKN